MADTTTTKDKARKFTSSGVALTAGTAAIATGAAVLSVAGPAWLAVVAAAAAGAFGVKLTDEIPGE